MTPLALPDVAAAAAAACWSGCWRWSPGSNAPPPSTASSAAWNESL